MEMKKILFVFIIIFLGVLSSCSNYQSNNKGDIDPICEDKALKLTPQKLLLYFERDPFDDTTIYILKKVTFRDGVSFPTDRGFSKKTTSGDNRYYPIANENKLERSWYHTEPIIYKDENFEAEYNLVLEPTDKINFEKRENEITKEWVVDKNRGDREFLVVDVSIKRCLISK